MVVEQMTWSWILIIFLNGASQQIHMQDKESCLKVKASLQHYSETGRTSDNISCINSNTGEVL